MPMRSLLWELNNQDTDLSVAARPPALGWDGMGLYRVGSSGPRAPPRRLWWGDSGSHLGQARGWRVLLVFV